VIKQIRIKGFKSLQDVCLNLGPLNLFVGTNASGKSNFLDALRVLQGLAYGFTVDEVLNGKPKTSSTEVWEGIRGGSRNAGFLRVRRDGTKSRQFITIGIALLLQRIKGEVEYEVTFSSRTGLIRSERLAIGGREVFQAQTDLSDDQTLHVQYNTRSDSKSSRRLNRDRSVLRQLPSIGVVSSDDTDLMERLVGYLVNMQRLEPLPATLRDYSQTQSAQRMGDHGEDFAAVVNSILQDPRAKSAYLSWLRQLTPIELDDVTIRRGALKEPMFALKERGRVFPAQVLSDGTLRFAAIAAAFFQPDMPRIFTIEEIENGIHPTRLRLLLDLLKSQAGERTQVMATSHSPVIVAWQSEPDYKSTFLCKRDEETGASIIKPLSDVPRFSELAGKHAVADMFAEGWLESVM
jgi:predicted ATPase